MSNEKVKVKTVKWKTKKQTSEKSQNMSKIDHNSNKSKKCLNNMQIYKSQTNVKKNVKQMDHSSNK